jgi:predicted O-methyltransferase YrrM
MDQAIETVLAELDERARREWQGGPQGASQMTVDVRDRMLLSIGRDAGVLVNMLAKSAGCRRILEIGTSYGYSTIWLAEAARASGGKVISLDVADYKQAHAAEVLERAGLRNHVEFHTGDALQIIPQLEGGFDFVLVDLWKDLYVPALDLFFPKLAPGATIVADNMLRPAADRTNALGYRRAVRARPGITSVLLPVGQGLEVSRLKGPEDEGL